MRKIANGAMALLLCSALALSFAGCKKSRPEVSDQAFSVASVSAVDNLGRVTYAGSQEKGGRDVGLFYFLWLGAHGKHVYDVSDLLENNPDELWSATSKISPVNAYHFWGEPLYGYYHAADPWVLTRHVELFTMAGIDFLGFDVTNGPTYDNVVRELLRILDKFQKQGWNVPKIMFITNSGSQGVITNLYNSYYKPDSEYSYPDLWYAPEGKPMICGNPRSFSSDSEIGQFFDIRMTDWPNAPLHDEESFPWMCWEYPQLNFSGIMSVSVAQHTASKMSAQEENWGRGYDQHEFENNGDKVIEGLNFESQWASVFDTFSDKESEDVHTVFVTGWNEWIAIKFARPDVYFVDAFNMEYSRDVEMMKGGYGDNYYLQLLRNVKKYKFEPAVNYKRPGGKGDDWSSSWAYSDFVGDAMARNFRGYESGVTYTDDTNRNDIARIEVKEDSKNYYFRVTAVDAITPYEAGDAGWMNLWLATSADGDFDYVVNREYGKVNRVTNGTYEVAGDAEVNVSGNVMTVKIAKKTLGKPAALRFRVSDNVDASDRMNFYIQGDSAPLGGMSYTYGYFK